MPIIESGEHISGEIEHLEKAKAALLHKPSLDNLEFRKKQIEENAETLKKLETEIPPLEAKIMP